MLDIHIKNLGTVAVLSLQGQFVIGQTEILYEAFQSLPAARSIVLDLGRISLIDAHGLGVMLQLREQAEANGTHFALMNVSNQLQEILRITRLDSVFRIDSEVGFFPRLVHPRRTPVAA